MKFCSACGSTVSLIVPAGDNRERHVCDNCDTIHYQNPKIVAGCLVESHDGILLCKRAIEPRYGLWTLPAGFMENGESTAEAAARETLEEANAEVEVGMLYSLINIAYINQVYVIFRATLARPDYAPGTESLAVEFFAQSDIPWATIAFPAITKTLRWYFEDQASGRFETHTGDIQRGERL